MNKQVTEYHNAPTEQKEIMKIIRSLIHKNVENVMEDFKWNRPIFKSTKDFAYLQSNKSYVNLGFYNGFEKLDDPKGLLEGTGKTMRHIKLKNVSDINHELLSGWFTILTKE